MGLGFLGVVNHAFNRFFNKRKGVKMNLSLKEIDWLISMYQDVIILNAYKQECVISTEQAEERISELVSYKASLFLNAF